MAYTNINDPSAYFQIALYTGTGSAQSITNDGNSDLQPDFLWFKNRSETVANTLWDSSRGITKFLVSEQTATDYTNPAGYELTSFNTDGFGLGIHNTAGINQSSSYNYVAWQWKANGGTTASNSSGATTTTVQANQDAGFSIITWTGNGATTTLGHGLGVTPDVIIVKARGTTSNWGVYHKNSELVAGQPYNSEIWLNSTMATSYAPGTWGTSSSDVNSNTFALKYWFNISSTLIAYCFAEKQGYSKFGKYVGNANANGAFVYTGFKPAWVMVKRSDGTSDWTILDNKREGYNIINKRLVANANSAEATYNVLDFVSNGFKFRDGDGIWNGSGSTYIYMAFAENPFVTSTGVPATAR